jgi:hypothetical protein
MPVTKDFRPQIYCDISDVLDEKVELLNAFASQSEKAFLKSNAVKGLSQYRALQSRLGMNVTAVEAFEVMQMGLTPNFNLLHNLQEQIIEPANFSTPFLKDIIVFTPAIQNQI